MSLDDEIDEILEAFRRVVWGAGWNSPSDQALEEAKAAIKALVGREKQGGLAESEEAKQPKDTKSLPDYYPYADEHDKTRAYKSAIIQALDHSVHPEHLKKVYCLVDKLKAHMESVL